MTRPASVDRQGHEPPLAHSLEARASMGLKLLAILNGIALMLAALPAAAPAASLFTATSIVATAAMTALYLAAAVSIDRGRPWAIAAVRPVLVVLLAFGVFETLAGAAYGRVRLPFETVVAIWAWYSARRDPAPRRDSAAWPQDRRGVALLGAMLAVGTLLVLGRPVFAWGGMFDVGPSDLQATLDVDCGDPSSGPPDVLTVTYDWSWTDGSPYPSGLDVVVIGWKGTDAEGRTMYLLGPTPPAQAGVYPNLQDVPSLDMALAVEHEWPGSWHWGIQLSEQQLRDGRIELLLKRVREGPGPFTLAASYVHVGLWRQDVAPLTCDWSG